MKYSTLGDFSSYLQKISVSDIPKSILLQGSDPFDIHEAHRLFKECGYRLFGEKGITFSRAREIDQMESLFSPSLFSRSKTVVVIEECDSLKAKEQEYLKRFLLRPSSDAFVLLKTSSTKLEFSKLVQASLSLPEEKPWDKEAKVVSWILSFVQARGVSIDSSLAALIAKEGSTDRFFLQGELEKLILSIGERKKIEEKDIQAVLTLESKSTLWQLSDVYMQKNCRQAVQILQHLEEQEIHSFVIIRHLRHVVHQALQMKSLDDNGVSSAQIAEQFSQLKGKLFEKSFQRAKATCPFFLTKSLIFIDKAESLLKNSPFDEQAVLINLLMQAMK
jgi:DNA polymerase III subunit delta